MFITKTLQPATSPPSHQQISMPVSHKKQSPVGLLTSDRPASSNQLPILLRCQWLPDRSASLPVRNLLHQLLFINEKPVLQPVRPATQLTVTHSVTRTRDMPDSDPEPQTDFISHVYPKAVAKSCLYAL